MRHIVISLFISTFLLLSCKKADKAINTVQKTNTVNSSQKQPKASVGKISDEASRELTKSYFMNFKFNAEDLQKQGLPIHKHFAEYLGLALKLTKTSTSDEERKAIKQKAKNVYDFTLKPEYHNLNDLEFKAFKKNNMSYMRILFLLQELGFKNDYYISQLKLAKKRIDDHLNARGDWQKCAFENYYNYFKLEKPAIIKDTKNLKGVVGRKVPAEKYDRNKAYELTHLVFIAFEYGEKKTQSKFDMVDIQYMHTVLPKLAKTYRLKRNTDLLSELVTCMKALGVNDPELATSIDYIKTHQNNDGSWGKYENARKKYGDLIELKAYLHNTLVVYESLTL